MKNRIIWVVALLVVMSTLLAACGGTSKTEYKTKVSSILIKADKAGEKLFGQQQPPDGKTVLKTSAHVKDLADDMDAITPPDDVAKLHKRAVGDLNDIAEALEKMAPMLDQISKNPAKAQKIASSEKFQRVQNKAYRALEDFDALSKAFKKKKYSKVAKSFRVFKES